MVGRSSAPGALPLLSLQHDSLHDNRTPAGLAVDIRMSGIDRLYRALQCPYSAHCLTCKTAYKIQEI